MTEVLHWRPIYFRWKQPAGGEWFFHASSLAGFRAIAVAVFRHSRADPHLHTDLKIYVEIERRWTLLTAEGFSPQLATLREQIDDAAEELWELAVDADHAQGGGCDVDAEGDGGSQGQDHEGSDPQGVDVPGTGSACGVQRADGPGDGEAEPGPGVGDRAVDGGTRDSSPGGGQ